MTGCAECGGPAHPPPSGGPERAWSSEPHGRRPRPSSAPHDAWRQAALSGGAESGAEVGPGRARLARVAEGPSGGQGSRGGPARSVSGDRARFREPGLRGGRSEGPGSVRGGRVRGGRQGAPEPAPARSLLAAASPHPQSRDAQVEPRGRVGSPGGCLRPPARLLQGKLSLCGRFQGTKAGRTVFRVSCPSTLFVSKADLSPSVPLRVSVGNSIKYDSQQIAVAVSFPRRLSKSWIRNARNGEGARRSRHHWAWFPLGEEAPPSPVPTVGSCRDGPSGHLEERLPSPGSAHTSPPRIHCLLPPNVFSSAGQ